MRCTVPGLNVKILGRVAQATAKIGDDLYLESSASGLVLRTINSSESAYCSATFGRSFFSHFDDLNTKLKCKISARSALAALKPQGRTEGRTEACDIRADLDASKLVFRLRFKHGVVKTHYLSILECKHMEVAFAKDDLPNRLSANRKTFSDAVDNFQPSDDQITFEAKAGTLMFRNFVGDDTDLPKTTRTQLSLKSAEFESYSIGREGVATFSTKEFKALLSLSEALDLSIASHFGSGGSPIVFVVGDAEGAFEANFVLATDKPDSGTQSAESTQRGERATKRTGDPVEDEGLRKRRTALESIESGFEFPDDSYLLTSIRIPDDEKAESAVNVERMLNAREIEQNKVNTVASAILPNKVKSVFRRCFDETIVDSKMNPAFSVIAGDSDSE